jgi:hypothetical protein
VPIELGNLGFVCAWAGCTECFKDDWSPPVSAFTVSEFLGLSLTLQLQTRAVQLLPVGWLSACLSSEKVPSVRRQE